VGRCLEFAVWFCQQLVDTCPGREHRVSGQLTLNHQAGVTLFAHWSATNELTLALDQPCFWQEPLGPEALQILIHEAAHALNMHHGLEFRQEVERLAGEAASLMLHRSQKSADAFDPVSAASDYQKVSWSVSRQQLIRSGLTFTAALQGQDTADTAMDGSDNMSLGGPNGVRAYPSGEASGPVGRVLNLELRWRVSPAWQIAPFYDWGQVSKRNESAGGPASYSLKGGGVGLTWSSSFGTTAQLTFARRHGDNPYPLDTGKDQDGSLKRDRFWLSVNQSF
jgi:hemolysin activation/secretion protein